jgi:hypothetical protein
MDLGWQFLNFFLFSVLNATLHSEGCMGMVGNTDFLKVSEVLETLVFTQKACLAYALVLGGQRFIGCQFHKNSYSIHNNLDRYYVQLGYCNLWQVR